MDIIIRQAHPGPQVPAYQSYEQKWHDALRYQREEGLAWDVLVDGLEGTVHQVYGGLADPAYLRLCKAHPLPGSLRLGLSLGAVLLISALRRLTGQR